MKPPPRSYFQTCPGANLKQWTSRGKGPSITDEERKAMTAPRRSGRTSFPPTWAMVPFLGSLELALGFWSLQMLMEIGPFL